MRGEEKIVRLSNRRKLCYLELGRHQKKALFFFHGFPGSRNQVRFIEQFELDQQFYIISPDRPGFGYSEFFPKRTLSDWALDIKEIADQLKIENFDILAVSGGGPYALACAYHLPERVQTVSIIGGLGPLTNQQLLRQMPVFNRLTLGLAQKKPGIIPYYYGLIGTAFRLGPEKFMKRMSQTLSEKDRALMQDEVFQRHLIQSFHDSHFWGYQGCALELELFTRPWAIPLEELNVPVHFWHGKEDRVVPYYSSLYLSEKVPQATMTLIDDEGHYSLAINYLEQILSLHQL